MNPGEYFRTLPDDERIGGGRKGYFENLISVEQIERFLLEPLADNDNWGFNLNESSGRTGSSVVGANVSVNPANQLPRPGLIKIVKGQTLSGGTHFGIRNAVVASPGAAETVISDEN
ncbi:hypothetical protein EVAR_76014_1 [Eumeta japonica]|uniref:Uncharacterized protein n=1 Tax=Eumeta variegata TaxID=151549 RepID=A0A4C1UB12_EUMVA|nr:hypothetical protein EVAR_76014_1 [Eumeta japonica]